MDVHYTVCSILLMFKISHNKKLFFKSQCLFHIELTNYVPSCVHLTSLDRIPSSNALTQVLRAFCPEQRAFKLFPAKILQYAGGFSGLSRGHWYSQRGKYLTRLPEGKI